MADTLVMVALAVGAALGYLAAASAVGQLLRRSRKRTTIRPRGDSVWLAKPTDDEGEDE